MATESNSGAERGLPFEDPLRVHSDQAETIKMASDDPAEISLQSGKDDPQPATQSSLDELMVYLQKGLNSLKGLNLNGFQQIYPVFLSILGAVIAALILVIASNILHSINHLPLIGDLLGGVLELCGLVVVSRFVLSNLLLQKKRADLFLRIATVKKELIGQ
ncbi:CAAD domain-containing protein [Synechococcus sp. KORDI-52]|uniref:CAAD domain-containing protein n=1 Tax=Synechococcus sp. KORDI-52 TaxID=585425 RepID=UPI000A007370|nr:CAAD domain-containing protein [Synechococcus sp. KORDI-52]